jgi:hypothetical protein
LSGRARAALVVLALASACGGGGGSPTTPPLTDAGLPVGTALSIVSGETGQPVAGATVVVAGRTQTSDGSGTVRLDQRADQGVLLDILSPGTLDRQTLLRSVASVRFSLWPKASATGLDQHYTSALVYTNNDDSPGAAPMIRVRAPQVAIVLSAELLADAAALEAHQRGAADLTAANGGVSFVVTDTRPSGVFFEARVDPAHERCGSSTRGTTGRRISASTITGGEIIYCRQDIARSPTVSHELGHTFGLQHSPDSGELMFGTFIRGRAETFGPRESLAMRLMLQRAPGNMFPDNDRSTAGSASTGTLVTVCR